MPSSRNANPISPAANLGRKPWPQAWAASPGHTRDWPVTPPISPFSPASPASIDRPRTAAAASEHPTIPAHHRPKEALPPYSLPYTPISRMKSRARAICCNPNPLNSIRIHLFSIFSTLMLRYNHITPTINSNNTAI